MSEVQELRGWVVYDSYSSDKTDLQITVFKKDDNMVVTFRGTKGWQDWLNNINTTYLNPVVNIINYLSSGLNKYLKTNLKEISIQTTEAKAYMLKLVKKNKRCKFYITGHSLGGHLAYDAGAECIRYNKKFIKEIVTFDGLGLIPDFNRGDRLSEKQLMNNKSIITDYAVIYNDIQLIYQNGVVIQVNLKDIDVVYDLSSTKHYGKPIVIECSHGLKTKVGVKILKIHTLYTFLEKLNPVWR